MTAPATVTLRRATLAGTVAAPPSKSVTHRAFLLAAQAEGGCVVRRPLLGADNRSTLGGLRAMGASFEVHADSVAFAGALLHAPQETLDCGNSGTTLRFLAVTAARFAGRTRLDGDASLRSRPTPELLAALASLGAVATGVATCAPLQVQGPLAAGAVRLPPGSSSQVASALLLALPFLDGDSSLRLAAPVASAPYVDVTLRTARAAGLRFDESHDDGRAFRVPGNQAVRARALDVEGDWSSAAFPLVAAAITGGDVTVGGLDPQSAQGDARIVELLRSFGAQVGSGPGGVRCRGGPLRSPGVVDVQATPDLFPALAALAACAQGTTTFVGGAALRRKESDRIAAMAEGLRRMGVACREAPAGLEVMGGRLRGASIAARGDHRIHMAFCVAALAASGSTTIDGAASADVSYPGFHEALGGLGVAEAAA